MATKTKAPNGYAVFNSRGELLWITIRRTKGQAIRAYRFQTGDSLPESFEVKPVTITYDEK